MVPHDVVFVIWLIQDLAKLMKTIENNKNYRNSISLLTIRQLCGNYNYRYIKHCYFAQKNATIGKNVRQVMQLVCISKFIFVGHLK